MRKKVKFKAKSICQKYPINITILAKSWDRTELESVFYQRLFGVK